MTAGVSMWSRGSVATFASVVGTWSADYPATHLADLINISRVSRFTPASGAAAFTFVLPELVPIQFVGLARHTMPAGVTMRVRLFKTNNPDPVTNAANIVHDSGVIGVWPSGGPVANYPSVRPYKLTAAIGTWSGRIDFASLPGAAEIGGVDLGEWWTLNISPGKEMGFDPRAPVIRYSAGGSEALDVWAPRILRGQVDYMHMKEAGTTGLDFQKSAGQSRPFIYTQDYEDPTTWPRSCMLMTNSELPPSVGALYRHDAFQVRFREHWR